MEIIFIILLCCILSCSLSSSSNIVYFWYDEVKKMKSEGETAIDNCKKNDNLLFRQNKTYSCAYGRNACAVFTDNGYSDFLCPLNYNFIADNPKGTKQRIINNILQFKSIPEEIFNSMYFIKKDLRQTIILYCNNNISKLQNFYPKSNTNNFINVKSGDLIKISKSSEVDNNGKKYDSYYLYLVYDLIITLPTGINIGLGKLDKNSGESIIINSLSDLKKAFAKMENSFQTSLSDEIYNIKQEENQPTYVTNVTTTRSGENDKITEERKVTTQKINVQGTKDVIVTDIVTISCDDVPYRIRQPKTKKDSNDAYKYSTLCFFYEKTDIGTIISLLQDILLKVINKSILTQYLTELQTKIKNNNTITIFEYVMYMALVNYILENNNYKFIFSVNN
jgi:hypothetical protein